MGTHNMTDTFKIRRDNTDIIITAETHPEEHAAMVAERAAWASEAEAAAVVATEHRTLRQQARVAITALNDALTTLDADHAKLTGPDPLVAVELRAILGRSVGSQRVVVRSVSGLIRVLVNANVIEREDA